LDSLKLRKDWNEIEIRLKKQFASLIDEDVQYQKDKKSKSFLILLTQKQPFSNRSKMIH